MSPPSGPARSAPMGAAPSTRPGPSPGSVILICLSCNRLAEVSAFHDGGGGALEAQCSECGANVPVGTLGVRRRPSRPAIHAVPAPRALDLDDVFSPPPLHCPKCIAPYREGQASCFRCGLDLDRSDLDGDLEPPQVLADAWKALQRTWEKAEAHARLLQVAHLQGLLTQAGRLYLIRLAWRPEDRMAQDGRSEVIRLASAGLGAEPSSADQASLLSRLGPALTVVLLGAMALTAAYFRLGGLL